MGNALCAIAFQASAFSLGVYDWLITIDREVNLIWVRRWTPAKILFLVNRHLGPLYLFAQFIAMLFPSPWLNRTWLEIKILFMGIFVWIWLLQFTLLYRTFAIYSRVESVKLVLVGGYILGVCTNFVIFPILLRGLKVESQDFNWGISCYFNAAPSGLVVFWLPSFVYGLVFVTLSVRIAVKHAQYSNLIYGTRIATWARFVQDCIFYFAITSAVLLGNVAACVTLPPEWYLIPMDFSIVVICGAGNRLVFRLIQVYHGPSDEQKSLNEIHMGDTLPLQVVAGDSGDHNRTFGSSIIFAQTRDSQVAC